VTLNGEAIAVPMHQNYKDGSELRIEDIGREKRLIALNSNDKVVCIA
jgi:hypothetical protein